MTYTECYVYEANSTPNPILVGKYWLEEGVSAFVYGKNWLARPDAFALDPLHLPLEEKIFHPKKTNGPINVLADAGVDNWGRRLITATHKRVPHNFVEWLLASGGRGVGCLMFSASRTQLKTPTLPILIDVLTQYLEVAQTVLDHPENKISKEWVKLLEHGTSMGGARPKTLVIHQGEEYIAKFNRRDDGVRNLARVEKLTMDLAIQCGICVATTSLIHNGEEEDILLVKRFDWVEDSLSRLHYISGHSLLNFAHVSKEDYSGDYSYMGLAKVIQKISAAPKEDAEELFRRMVFNGFVGNSDDHLKNHGMLMVDRKKSRYRLSPAFDILPHYLGNPQLLAIGCGTKGQQASVENFLSCCERFYLSKDKAFNIIQEIKERVSGYEKFYEENGVSKQDIKILKPCFSLVNKK
jgi:serine/threonine-protein kinase HipA